jgi:hypothetical protein
MALIAMSSSDVLDFVSDLDPAKSQKSTLIDPNDPSKGEIMDEVIGSGATVFELKSLDVFLMGYIYDNASTLSGEQGSNAIGIHTRMNQTNIEAVRHGLVGFRNFADAKGKHIQFSTQSIVVNGRKYEVASDDTVTRLGIRLIQELASKIKEISEVTADEEKNSAKA